jgi:hypothetical protein
LSDDRSHKPRSERRLQLFIPLGGVLIAALLILAAIAVAPDDGAQGFRRDAEIMKMLLTLAVAFVSGAVVSYLIGENGREVEERRKRADERRRLVNELREVHHAVTTAKLRIRAHRTVRTYGIEIRDVIVPKVSQLGGVISDLDRDTGVIPGGDAKAISNQIKIVAQYLKSLTDEYEEQYLAASLMQEVDYEWRQYRVKELVKEKGFAQKPPTEAMLPAKAQIDSSAWSYLKSAYNDDNYRFPRLLVYLELEEGKAASDILSKSKNLPYKHLPYTREAVLKTYS